MEDHDLLIRIEERLIGMDARLTSVTRDHEKRVRALEKRQWINFGAVGASCAALGTVIKHVFLGGAR